jgi:hypothetical protein
MLSWRHGPIIAGLAAVGLAGAVILAQGSTPEPVTYQAAVDASDDPYAAPSAPASATGGSASGGNVAPAPTSTTAEEPSELMVEPIATFTCRNRTGDARRPIQCDGRKKAHAWLTVPLKKKLPTPAAITLDEYSASLVDTAPRATGRYVRIESDLDVRAAKGATMRISYTPAELKTWNATAKKLAIAAYDTPFERWIVLPSTVNQRARYVQASFATKRLPDQLFALVTRP